MLTVKRFVVNPLQENTYVVSDETRECVIIDCGAFSEHEAQAIIQYVNDNHLTARHLLCTHGHFDHVMGNSYLCEHLQLHPEYSQLDESLIGTIPSYIAPYLSYGSLPEQPSAASYLSDGSIIAFGTHRLVALAAPGHTAGGLIFHCIEEHLAFTGDTLFRMSIGRTDFPESNPVDMEATLRNVVRQLPADTVVYPGHGPQSVMADEIAYNPYLYN